MSRSIAGGRIAGAVTLLARRGETAHLEASGFMDLATRRPMREDAIFRIFSMTKPVTSVALLMLLEEGRLHLDWPVAEFIPELSDLRVRAHPARERSALARDAEGGERLEALIRPVIVHDLLTHSSGLGYGLETTDPLEARWHAADLLRMDESLEEKMPRIAALPLHHQPGLRYTYSIGTDVLARIVEVASGQAFDEFLEARIFGPLGMADTGFFVPPSKLERLASLYTPGPDGRLVDAASLDLSAAPHFMKGAWIDKSKKPRFLSGGGGLVSTASDYLRFALMLKNGGAFEGERILGRKTVELMTSPFLTGERFPIPGCAYGLGLTILTSPALARFPGSRGSFGGGGAANTDFWVDPSEDLVGILMVQLASTSPCPVAQDFRATALQAVVE